MGRAERPRGPELEFLPELLEIQQAPPSPVGRAIAWTVMAVFLGAIVWAGVGTVEVVAVARGKVIPSGHSKVVQPSESGIIRAIHVRDGQAVRKGQVLLELDPTTSDADLRRLVHEHLAGQVDAERLSALIAGRRALQPPTGADPRLVALQEQRLVDQLTEYESRLESARFLIEQRKAALEATRADIERLEAIVPMLNERAAAYKKLFEQEYVAKMQYWEMEQQRIERVQELAGKKHRLVQDLAALAEAQKQSQVIEMEFKRSRLAELAEVETRAASLSQEVVKASQRARIQKLTAPIDGVVQQLAVHTVGGVVTPAQSVMVIVPREHHLEVEAWLENKDIGFVRPGQPAEVKVDTFPFTRYGTINGQVTTVSGDAVPLEQGGLVYATRVSLERASLPVDGTPVSLSPGMAVTVEIKTDERRVIEFFLSPVLRYVKESVRER
jgi:hemolysin D